MVVIVVATILNKALEYFLFLVTMQEKELCIQYIQDAPCNVIYFMFSGRHLFVWISLEGNFFFRSSQKPKTVCQVAMLIENGFQHLV